MHPPPNDVRAIILDYGMVLCRRPSLAETDRIAKIFGVDHATFWQLYEKNRGAYDQNDIGGKEYWGRFASETNTYENLPLAEMKDHFDAIQSSAYSVSLFTDWQNQRINEVWIKSRMAEGQAFDATPEFFGAKRATKNLHPIAELSAENCTEQMGVPGPWYERLPHFRMGFTPSAGKELQTEYFVPRQHAVEAILAVERLRDRISPHLMISEIRAIAADNLWLSPCHEQPSVTIHFTWKQDWPAVKMLMPFIEKELAPFKARPHWGKLFTVPPSELHSIYKKLPDFVQLSKKYDPHGKFRNEFLSTNIFSS